MTTSCSWFPRWSGPSDRMCASAGSTTYRSRRSSSSGGCRGAGLWWRVCWARTSWASSAPATPRTSCQPVAGSWVWRPRPTRSPSRRPAATPPYGGRCGPAGYRSRWTSAASKHWPAHPRCWPAAEIRASLGDPKVLMLGVDRLDYTKGIRHRLKAYEELLQDKVIAPPEVTLMQVATPSRERVDAYRHLREEIEGTVGRINGEYSDIGSPAVYYLYHSYPRNEMAAMFLAADVMLVTPLRDGMNLVAKEYVTCRHDLGGALVLSEFAGAWHELHQAFICNPHDIEGVKQTILRAINTPVDERQRRMKALRKRVATHDVQRWASRYLEAL